MDVTGCHLVVRLMGPYFDWEGWLAILDAAVWPSWPGGFKTEAGARNFLQLMASAMDLTWANRTFPHAEDANVGLEPKSTNL